MMSHLKDLSTPPRPERRGNYQTLDQSGHLWRATLLEPVSRRVRKTRIQRMKKGQEIDMT
jgi:hypothetical protein